MPRMRRVHILFALLALVLSSTVPMFAKASTRSADPQLRDAVEYAADQGITLDEAIRRLRLQELTGELATKLMANEEHRFAGLWIQHTPTFRIIVQLTSGTIETIQPYLANSILTSEIEVRNVRVPLATLRMDQEFAIRTLQKLDLPVNSGINVAQNRVELYVTDRQKLDHALATAAIHLPATISVISVKALAAPEADLFGGLQINGPTLGCTSGFSVLHRASGATGILTAGHCDDTLTYLGVQLPFWNQRVAGAYDIQFNAAGTHTVRNWIYAGGANRTITGKMTWGQQAVGNFVCKQGRTTGYTCGYIVDKNYTYQGASTWIRVHRDGVNLSEGGDSGGPWFTANTAYGVHAAGVGDDAIYQATDYAEIGVSVVILTQ